MKNILLILIGILCFSACRVGLIRGNGNIVTKNIEVADFSALKFGGGIKVSVVKGPANKVEVTTDENIFDILNFEKQGKYLYIHYDKPVMVNSSNGINVKVEMPDFEGAQVSGGGELNFPQPYDAAGIVNMDFSGGSSGNILLAAKELSINMSGGAEAKIESKGDRLKLSLSGGSQINNAELKYDFCKIETSGGASVYVKKSEVREAEVSMSGGSSSELSVSEKLKVNGSGGATFTLQGGNPTIEKDMSGGAKIVLENK